MNYDWITDRFAIGTTPDTFEDLAPFTHVIDCRIELDIAPMLDGTPNRRGVGRDSTGGATRFLTRNDCVGRAVFPGIREARQPIGTLDISADRCSRPPPRLRRRCERRRLGCPC